MGTRKATARNITQDQLSRLLATYAAYRDGQIVKLDIRRNQNGWNVILIVEENDGKSQGSIDGVKPGSDKIPVVLRRNQPTSFKINRNA